MNLNPVGIHCRTTGFLGMLAILVMVSYLNPAAQAGTIHIQESWEGFINGVIPTSPFGTTKVQSGDSVAVTTTLGSPFEPFDPFSNSILINNGPASAAPGLKATFTAPTDKPLTIIYDWYQPSAGYTAPSGNAPAFVLNQGNTRGILLQAFGPVAGPIKLYNASSGGSTLLASLNFDTWYQFRIVVAPADNTNDIFTLTLTPYGGTSQIFTNLPFKANLTAYDSIMFIDNIATTNTGYFNIDNVSVRVHADMQVRPLKHLLQPTTTDQVLISLDSNKTLTPTEKKIAGVSFSLLTSGPTQVPYGTSGALNLSNAQIQAIKDLKLPMTRVYSLGAEYYGTAPLAYNLTGAIDKFKELVTLCGIPQENAVLEFEGPAPVVPYPVAKWIQGVSHSLQQNYKFHDWEIGNETYTKHAAQAYPNPQAYVDHFIQVSQAIKATDPYAKIGISIKYFISNPNWREYVLENAAGYYDFVVAHYYNFGKTSDVLTFSEAVLAENYKTLNQALEVNELIQAFNPDKKVFQYDTEWGKHDWGSQKNPAKVVTNANIVGTLHRIVRMIYYARGGILKGASSWVMFGRTPESMGLALLPAYDDTKTTMFYWAYYYMNRHIGDELLDMQGTSPYIQPTGALANFSGPEAPVLATISKDRKTIYIVAVNGLWDKDLPCDISIGNFTAGLVTAVKLSSADITASPVLNNKSDFVTDFPLTFSGGSLNFTLPAHSAVFITMTQ